jgi:prepilin-type N-terminal cleavage/methylation domain-containing protein
MPTAAIVNSKRIRSGFTLIELLVSMVILSTLAALSLSGLASSKQRSKIDKTKSTIRKLHEIIMPQYESYLSRRVAGGTPVARLQTIRRLMVREMPDQWDDVGVGAETPSARRFTLFKQSLEAAPATNVTWRGTDNKHQIAIAYEGPECLAMIVLRGGFATDSSEQFRADEIGDIDKDGAPEFWDGWGRPIAFIRWPAGFSSSFQQQDASINPESFDPFNITPMLSVPESIERDERDNNGDGNVDELGERQRDYGLIPLIYSPGPDEASNDPMSGASGYGIVTSRAAVNGTDAPDNWMRDGWLVNTDLSTTRVGLPMAGHAKDSTASDNITNHDLLKK